MLSSVLLLELFLISYIAYLPDWAKGWSWMYLVPLVVIHLNTRTVHPVELAFRLLQVPIFLDFQANQSKAKRSWEMMFNQVIANALYPGRSFLAARAHQT